MKDIIIGRTPSCLLFSWRTQTPCLLDSAMKFHVFDEAYNDLDFSEFNAASPKQMIANLSFALGITGLLLQPNNVESLRHEDGKIKVFTKGSRLVEYEARPLFFDGKETGDYLVFDSFWWRAGCSHDCKEIISNRRLARKVIFYSSRRRHVAPTVKDVMVLSKMNESELLSPDNGNGIVRVKALRMMSDEGLRGKFAHEKNGKRYYKSIKLEFNERKILPLYKQKHTFREVYEMEQKQERQWRMFERLRFKRKIW